MLHAKNNYFCGMSSLRSMTGFGAAELANNNFLIKTELKTLNGKYYDCNLRLSRYFKSKENEIRQWANSRFMRGSVQLNIHAELHGNQLLANQMEINTPLAVSYKEKLDQFTQTLGFPNADLFTYLIGLPEMVSFKETQTTDEDNELLFDALNKAYEQLDSFRLQEGAALANMLQTHVSAIRSQLDVVKEMESLRKEEKTIKLQNAIADLNEKVGFDANRFEYELLYYLEKLDVQEEMSRLAQHLSYFEESLLSDNAGKKLGFIAQEMGREINTLGSKANFFPMQKAVVQMKEELEKVKEQTLNLL